MHKSKRKSRWRTKRKESRDCGVERKRTNIWDADMREKSIGRTKRK
jgi:hypothetical protein